MFAKKVLVVDDEEHIRELLSDLLTQRGFSVKTAADGKQALEAAKSYLPNVTFLDYIMPKCSALDIYPKIKKIFPFTKVIIITGRGSEEVAVRALKMGVDDYLTKPIDADKVVDSANYYLERQREEIIKLNGKYDYPIDTDDYLCRYEYLRQVHFRDDLRVKVVTAFFDYNRQDYYCYLNRFKKWGMAGLMTEKEIRRLIKEYSENRFKKRKPLQFKPFPVPVDPAPVGPNRLEEFLNWNDFAQVKLEMIREAAVIGNSHVGDICRKYGITRESFYQSYRIFQKRGIFGLLGRKKGRPNKQKAASLLRPSV